jgi:hypothetical protein
MRARTAGALRQQACLLRAQGLLAPWPSTGSSSDGEDGAANLQCACALTMLQTTPSWECAVAAHGTAPLPPKRMDLCCRVPNDPPKEHQDTPLEL